MACGLKTGEVALSDWTEQWIAEFEEARFEMLAAGLEWCRIEHVGSTAVRGLRSKPIIDIAIGVGSLAVDLAAIVRVLEGLGYEYRGFRPDAGGDVLRFMVGPSTTRHVHVVEIGGRQWQRYFLLRDYLTTDGTARDLYAEEKERLAAMYPNDRRAYAAAKDQLVDAMVLRASVGGRGHARR